ncbi:MAG: methyltransferase domain-containing protein [Candidatus Doudnabacteria bacterium]
MITFYTKLANLYDKTYLKKDYQKEVLYLKKFIKGSVLDVGCGTGRHLQYLKDHIRIGLDKSLQLIKLAKQNNPGIKFLQGDIVNFKINQKFDTIISLFTVIAYLNSKQLEEAINNLVSHLNSKGILILEPFAEPKTLSLKPWFNSYNSPTLKFTRYVTLKKIRNIAKLNIQWWVNGNTIKEVQHLSLFKHKHIIKLLNKYCVKVEYLPPTHLFRYGLFVARIS